MTILPLIFFLLLPSTFSQFCSNRPFHQSTPGSATITTFSQFCFNRPFHRTTLGNASISILTDGPFHLSYTYFNNVPTAAVERSYKASFRNTIVQQNVLLFDTPSNRVLVDTGSFNAPLFGDHFKHAGLLQKHLRSARIDPASIDVVILTHAHPDHVAGLIDKRGTPLFKTAKVYIGRIEHTFWTSDPLPELPTWLDQKTLQPFATTYINAIKLYERSGRLVLVEDGDSPLPGITFIHTPGHTPGHMALELSFDGEIMIVAGDAWITKADQLQHPEWAFSMETDRDAAYDSRIKLLERVAEQRLRVLVYHEQFPGLGFVQKVGPAFDWIPEAGIGFGGDFCG